MSTLNDMRVRMRYWIFPASRKLDEQIEELERHAEERKKLNNATRAIVADTNQSDVLRNLVVAIQGTLPKHKGSQ